jgi:hypothetical protein
MIRHAGPDSSAFAGNVESASRGSVEYRPQAEAAGRRPTVTWQSQ